MVNFKDIKSGSIITFDWGDHHPDFLFCKEITKKFGIFNNITKRVGENTDIRENIKMTKNEFEAGRAYAELITNYFDFFNSIFKEK